MSESILKKALLDSLKRIVAEIKEGVRRAPEAHRLRMNEHHFPWALIEEATKKAREVIGKLEGKIEDKAFRGELNARLLFLGWLIRRTDPFRLSETMEYVLRALESFRSLPDLTEEERQLLEDAIRDFGPVCERVKETTMRLLPPGWQSQTSTMTS
jgi:hypothetical protein